jgi:hypothetical protein
MRLPRDAVGAAGMGLRPRVSVGGSFRRQTELSTGIRQVWPASERYHEPLVFSQPWTGDAAGLRQLAGADQ